jgi:hypothetical protein
MPLLVRRATMIMATDARVMTSRHPGACATRNAARPRRVSLRDPLWAGHPGNYAGSRRLTPIRPTESPSY